MRRYSLMKLSPTSLACLLAVSLAPNSLVALEFTVWHSYAESSSKEFLEVAESQLSQKTKHKIQFEYIDNAQVKPALIKAKLENKLPSAVIAAADFVGMHEMIKLSPVSIPVLASPEQVQTTSIEGTNYGVPVTGGNHLLFFYNRDLVKKTVETFADLQKFAKKRPELSKKGPLITWNTDEPFWIAAFLGAYKVRPVQKGKIKLQTQQMQEGLRNYYDLLKRLGLKDCDYGCAIEAFRKGEAAFHINGIWAYGELKEHFGSQLGVSRLPTLQGKRLRPMMSTVALMFPDNSLKEDPTNTLKTLAEVMQSEEVQQAYVEAGYIAINPKVSLPKQDPNWQAVVDQLQDAVPMPSEAEMVFVWEALRKGWIKYKASRRLKQKNQEGMIVKYMQRHAEKAMRRAERNAH